ncbi:MAG: radical SAM protein [Candidatus Marinimicrobia bacterium]|nr:radical SAM protein [Candidatus Neomarinimicrobiota bacterium]
MPPTSQTDPTTRAPEIEYQDFSLRVHSQTKRRRLPLGGSLEVTFRCNFRCIHCYCVNEKPKQDLSLAEIRHLLDQMADEGCLWLLLTGGEPLLRPDFPEIYQYARHKGMITTVFTNASLVTDEIADLLGRLKPFVVEISLYGFSPETYQTVTGRAENFARVLEGLDRLQHRGVPVKLKSMILRQNIEDLPLLREYAEARGLPYRFDPVLNPTLSGSTQPEDLMLSPEEIVRLDLEDAERLKGWREFCDKFTFACDDGRLYKCGAGQWGFHIDPEGKLSLCMFARQQQYDLRQGSFHEAFYDFLPQVLAQKETRVTRCASCEIRSLCGQCPGWAYLHSGDQEKPVDYLCRLAHARAKAFGVAVKPSLPPNEKLYEPIAEQGS